MGFCEGFNFWITMSNSIYDFISKEVQKMVDSFCNDEKGNIYPLIVSEVERCVISSVLKETKGNYFRTAKSLGISRSTLYRKIKKLGIENDQAKTVP